MPQHPSEVDLSRPARYSKAFAANFLATDLTAQTGKPNHAAQVVQFHNAGASAENAVYVTVDGETLTESIAAGGKFIPPIPVASLSASSDADVSAKAYWWPVIGHLINP
jgi:hypothetical protein